MGRTAAEGGAQLPFRQIRSPEGENKIEFGFNVWSRYIYHGTLCWSVRLWGERVEKYTW